MLQRVAPAPDLARARAEAAPARIVIQAWIASRGLIFAVALVLAVVQGRTLTDLVSNWDVQHFNRLAVGGYFAEPGGVLMAFFPGLPVLLSLLLQVGVPLAVGGVLISTVCSAVAAAALYRLGGPWAAVLWLFAPTAVFTVVPYTESLFCALAFWAWERARSDRWAQAAGLAALACTVRVSGLFLIGALLVMVLTSAAGWPVKLRRAAWLGLPALVIAGFAGYLHLLTGSWTAWYAAQSTGWVRELTWPWQSFLNTVPAIVPGAYADHPWWAAVFRGEMISMLVGVAVTVACVVLSWRRRHLPGERPLWAEASWVGVQVLAFSLSYWFFSVNRATLLWFPLWILLARSGSARTTLPGRSVIVVGLVLEGLLMLGWSWLFFTGHWAS